MSKAEELIAIITKLENIAEEFRNAFGNNYRNQPEYRFINGGANVVMPVKADVCMTDGIYRKLSWDAIKAMSLVTRELDKMWEESNISVYAYGFVTLHLDTDLYEDFASYCASKNIGRPSNWQHHGEEHRSIDYNHFVTVYDAKTHREPVEEEESNNDDI